MENIQVIGCLCLDFSKIFWEQDVYYGINNQKSYWSAVHKQKTGRKNFTFEDPVFQLSDPCITFERIFVVKFLFQITVQIRVIYG